MELEEQVRAYKDRLRIFLILYFFSEDYSSSDNSTYKKVFKSEIRIQKIDFLIRNPDYLAYELLMEAKKNAAKKNEIKAIVKGIFQSGEPQFRRLDMERFFFGAYEDIDDVIAFLSSIDFIGFSSKKSVDLKTIEKSYYITDFALKKVGTQLVGLPALKWYVDRCQLIHTYFGNLTGSQLKVAQYEIDEYRNTSFKEFIGDISETVKSEYYALYNETL